MVVLQPTVQVRSDGRVTVILPRDETGRFAENALKTILPEGCWRLEGAGGLRVDREQLPVLVGALEHYYESIAVLNPEILEGGPVVSPLGASESLLSGLSPELARKVYLALAKVLHPDVGGDEGAFKALQVWKDSSG